MKTMLLFLGAVLISVQAFASDQITGVQANTDGSYYFNFLFDDGNGTTGSTVVTLPAPQPTFDGNGNVISAAVPYTLETAQAAVLPLAAAKKQTWLTAIGSGSVVGTVTLPAP